MENMDKGLIVPNRLKIPQMTQNCLFKLSAQAQKFAISMKIGFIGRP